MDTHNLGFSTRLVHAGIPEDAHGSVVTPIYQTSTFAFRDASQGAARFAGTEEGYIYTRIGNPTTAALEENLAQLENGYGATATASGMGAVSTVYLALLNAGDHVVSTDSVYGPSRGLMEKHMRRFQVESTYVDTADLEKLRAALRPNTRMVYVETPSNPAMSVTDIRASAELARQAGAVLVVDNTFASPFLQKPLGLGADVVLHSVTKFINGHADVVGGILVAKTEALHKRLRAMLVNLGANMDPHQAYLVSRGLKTLALRVERAQENAKVIASWLAGHPAVAWVRYVGLPSHPQYRAGQTADVGPRRHDRLRAGRWPGSGPGPHGQRAPGRPGRVPGGRGDAHQPPGFHDPCRHPPGGPPRVRHHRWSGPPVGRHRGHRRSPGRPGTGPRPGAPVSPQGAKP